MENKIKIDEIKRNIIKEHLKVSNTNMKDRTSLKMMKKTIEDKDDKQYHGRFTTRL